MSTVIGDVAESIEKKLKALNATDDNTAEQEERNADMYKHIKDAKEEKSTQVNHIFYYVVLVTLSANLSLFF